MNHDAMSSIPLLRSASPVPAAIIQEPNFDRRHQAYEALLSRHLQTLRRWASGRMRNTEDAEDVVQQTLLLAFRHFDQFRYEASFGTWLCRIAINVIRARMRRPDYWRAVSIDPQVFATWEMKDPQPSPLAELEPNEVRIRIHRAISALPEPYRDVVELRDIRGLTIRETADLLGLTTPAIKSRLFRARSMLRKCLVTPV